MDLVVVIGLVVAIDLVIAMDQAVVINLAVVTDLVVVCFLGNVVRECVRTGNCFPVLFCGLVGFGFKQLSFTCLGMCGTMKPR